MKNQVVVEFHCHSEYSKDSLVPVNKLIDKARRIGINKLAITDHNTIDGALIARQLAPELIIVGEEILTNKGELLALFVKEEVAPWLSPEKTIQRLRDQGAFIIVPHPFDRRRHGWYEDDLIQLIQHVDAIEVFNARCMNDLYNQKALHFAQLNNMAFTVGSDAHTLREMGRATLALPAFNSADELREIINFGKKSVKLSSPFIHMTSFYAKIWKKFYDNTVK